MWNVKEGDVVCSLLGDKTPFVLRRLRGNGKGADGRQYRVVGETYLDGYMEHEGDMEADIASGKQTLEW